MTKGWFVGDFEPSIIRTKDCEVGVKSYKKGSIEEAHFHKQTHEVTLIIKGKAKINNLVLHEGDIILINPNEVAQFEALEDVITVVYKSSSVTGDKFLINEI